MYRWMLRHEQIIVRTTQWLLLATLLTPLVYVTSFIFPFITVKVFFFRSVVALALGGYAMLLLISWERYRPARDTITMLLLVFMGWLLISALFGADFAHSWWGDYERMMGVFTLLHYAVFFVLARNLFRDAASWRRVWWGMIVVGVVVCLGAVVQRFNPDFLSGGARAASTLGNPIYLATYAGYVGFVSVYLLGDLWKKRAVHGFARYLPWALCVVLVIAILAFVWSETRGAVVGLVAAFLWMCCWIALGAERRLHRWAAIGALAFVTVSAAFVVWGGDTRLVQSVPVLRRFADVSITGSNETRLRTWRIGLEAWQDRPIVGWGWMNFAVAYSAYFDPIQLKHGILETWVDQAHNMLVELLTNTGTVGFVLYNALWAVVFFTLWRAFRRRGVVSFREWVLFSGLLVFHFVQNLFVFEQPTSLLTLLLLFAWVARHAAVRTQPAASDASPLVASRLAGRAAGVVAALVIALVYYGNVVPARANMLQIEASEALGRGDVSLWFGRYQQALLLTTPHRADVRSEMAHELLSIQKELPSLPRSAVDELMNVIAHELRVNADTHPRNVRYLLTYAEFLAYQYEQFRAEHPEAGPEAVRVYERALLLSPRRQQIALLMANAILATEDFQKAKSLLYLARALSPSIAEAHIAIAEIFLRANLFEDAIQSYETAIRILGSPQASFRTLDDWQRVGLLHIEHGDPLRGSWILETMVSCAIGRVSWRPCIEEEDMNPKEMLLFRPSRKAFGALVLYYRKKGDLEKSAFYDDLAHSYYADFTVQEGVPDGPS